MPRGGSIGFCPAAGRKPTRARGDPLLQALEAADLIDAVRRRQELEQPAAFDERLLALADARPVGDRQRVVRRRPRGPARVPPRRARGPSGPRPDPSTSSGERATSNGAGCPASMRRIVWGTRSRSSSDPGRSNSKRTVISSSSGFPGSVGPTSTIVRAEPSNSCAASRSVRSVAGFSRCACGSLSSQTPSSGRRADVPQRDAEVRRLRLVGGVAGGEPGGGAPGRTRAG